MTSLILFNDVLLQVRLHLGEHGSAETSNCVPSLGGNEAYSTTALFSAVVVASSDVSVSALVSSVHLVQQRIGETDRVLAMIEHVAVQQRDDPTEHWR